MFVLDLLRCFCGVLGMFWGLFSDLLVKEHSSLEWKVQRPWTAVEVLLLEKHSREKKKTHQEFVFKKMILPCVFFFCDQSLPHGHPSTLVKRQGPPTVVDDEVELVEDVLAESHVLGMKSYHPAPYDGSLFQRLSLDCSLGYSKDGKGFDPLPPQSFHLWFKVLDSQKQRFLQHLCFLPCREGARSVTEVGTWPRCVSRTSHIISIKLVWELRAKEPTEQLSKLEVYSKITSSEENTPEKHPSFSRKLPSKTW